MKFYFCEGCGTRITDSDIDEGLAKNKKLKGVYCRNCAIGLSTTTSMPLTDDKTKALLLTEASSKPSSPKPGSGPTPGRRTSAGNTLAAHRQRSPKREAGESVSKLPIFAVVSGLALITVVVAAVLISSKTSPASKRKRNRADTENDWEIPTPKKKTQTPPTTTVPEKKEDPDTGQASISFARFDAQLSRLDPKDLKTRIALAEEFLKNNPEAASAQRVNAMLLAWRRLADPKKRPPPPIIPEIPPPEKPDPPKSAPEPDIKVPK